MSRRCAHSLNIFDVYCGPPFFQGRSMTEDGGAALTVGLENQALVVFQGVILAPENPLGSEIKQNNLPKLHHLILYWQD